jgi:ketosteroid isomerase-like protein
MGKNGRLKAWLAIVIALLFASGAQAQSIKLASKLAPDAEFKAMIDEYYAAWSSMNPDNPAKFYAKDADLVFYDIAPMQYTGWAQYKEGVVKNFFSTVTSARLIPNNDLKVTRRGNVAWTTLTFHISAKPKAGGEMEIDARHTAIWEKRAGRWLIVHEHVSAPLPG